jgi:hypothetical protein
MEPDRPDPDPDGAPEEAGSGAEDTLRRLEERLDRASAAAERLIAQAGSQAAARLRAVRPPAAGWQADGASPGADGGAAADVELLATVLRSLRELIPPELETRLVEALRELLLAVRALIDWYVERLDRKRAEPVEVEDIPIV